MFGTTELIMTLAVFVIALVFAGLCASLAKAKGRDRVVWGILGFFFNLIPLGVLLILPSKKGSLSRQP